MDVGLPSRLGCGDSCCSGKMERPPLVGDSFQIRRTMGGVGDVRDTSKARPSSGGKPHSEQMFRSQESKGVWSLKVPSALLALLRLHGLEDEVELLGVREEEEVVERDDVRVIGYRS